MEVEINGQLISPGCAYYGQLFQTITDTTFGEDVTNRRSLLQNSLNVTTAPLVNQGTALAPIPFTIVNWLNFLGSACPSVLDTNLLGNVRLRITLASANVLVSSTVAVTGANYNLTNMFFSVDCISLDDGVYYSLHY